MHHEINFQIYFNLNYLTIFLPNIITFSLSTFTFSLLLLDLRPNPLTKQAQILPDTSISIDIIFTHRLLTIYYLRLNQKRNHIHALYILFQKCRFSFIYVCYALVMKCVISKVYISVNCYVSFRIKNVEEQPGRTEVGSETNC